MTSDNYAAIQRNLGLLEGLAYSLPEPMQILAFSAIEAISETIDNTQEEGKSGKV